MTNAQRQRSDASHRGALTKVKQQLNATLEANKALEEEAERLRLDNTLLLSTRDELRGLHEDFGKENERLEAEKIAHRDKEHGPGRKFGAPGHDLQPCGGSGEKRTPRRIIGPRKRGRQCARRKDSQCLNSTSTT